MSLDRVTFSLPRAYLYAAAGLVAGFVAGFFAATLARGPGAVRSAAAEAAPVRPQAAEPARRHVATEGRPSRGPAGARVTIVEFTDYQCPFCRQHYEQTLGPLHRLLGDSIRYVVRNFPIPSLHPEAEATAIAAECAFEQDRFWPYHDRLFEATEFSEAALRRYARDLRLDLARFDDCTRSPAARARVQQDVRDGIAAGIQGTPAFFVNGRPIEGAVPLEIFALAVQQALTETAR